MARRSTKAKPVKTLEQTLWEAADKLRGNQEPSEYKHVVLGLVFLKYVSDRFEERRDQLKEELTADGIKPERIGAFLEERDEYTSNNVFWVPEEARWASVQDSAKHPQIGEMIDNAMDADFSWRRAANDYMDIYHDLHPEIIRYNKRRD